MNARRSKRKERLPDIYMADKVAILDSSEQTLPVPKAATVRKQIMMEFYPDRLL